jgi:hypothetical protein
LPAAAICSTPATTGGAGTNEFAFTAPGRSGVSATPQRLPAGQFVSDSAGTCTAVAQRFAYDAANGELFYSASGVSRA